MAELTGEYIVSFTTIGGAWDVGNAHGYGAGSGMYTSSGTVWTYQNGEATGGGAGGAGGNVLVSGQTGQSYGQSGVSYPYTMTATIGGQQLAGSWVWMPGDPVEDDEIIEPYHVEPFECDGPRTIIIRD